MERRTGTCARMIYSNRGVDSCWVVKEASCLGSLRLTGEPLSHSLRAVRLVKQTNKKEKRKKKEETTSLTVFHWVPLCFGNQNIDLGEGTLAQPNVICSFQTVGSCSDRSGLCFPKWSCPQVCFAGMYFCDEACGGRRQPLQHGSVNLSLWHTQTHAIFPDKKGTVYIRK